MNRLRKILGELKQLPENFARQVFNFDDPEDRVPVRVPAHAEHDEDAPHDVSILEALSGGLLR